VPATLAGDLTAGGMPAAATDGGSGGVGWGGRYAVFLVARPAPAQPPHHPADDRAVDHGRPGPNRHDPASLRCCVFGCPYRLGHSRPTCFPT